MTQAILTLLLSRDVRGRINAAPELRVCESAGDHPREQVFKSQLALFFALMRKKSQNEKSLVLGTYPEEQALARSVYKLIKNAPRKGSKNRAMIALLDRYEPCLREQLYPLEGVLRAHGTPELRAVSVRLAPEFPGIDAVAFRMVEAVDEGAVEVSARDASDAELEEFLDAYLDFDWRDVCTQQASREADEKIRAMISRLSDVEGASLESIALCEGLVAALAGQGDAAAMIVDDLRQRVVRERRWLFGWCEGDELPGEALEQCAAIDEPRTWLDGLFLAWQRAHAAGDYRTALFFAERLRALASAPQADPRAAARAALAIGSSCMLAGRVDEAWQAMQEALATHDAHLESNAEDAARDGIDIAVGARTQLAMLACLRGDAALARQHADAALRRAAVVGHALTSAVAHTLVADCADLLGEPAWALEVLDAGRAHGELPPFGALMAITRAAAEVALGARDPQRVDRMLADVEEARGHAGGGSAYRLLQVARVARLVGDDEHALFLLDQARVEARASGELTWVPEALRMSAQIAASRGQVEAARREFDEALALARAHGSKAFEERILAELSKSPGAAD